MRKVDHEVKVQSKAYHEELTKLGDRCFTAWIDAGFQLRKSHFENQPNVTVINGLDWAKIAKLFDLAGSGRISLRDADSKCVDKVRKLLQEGQSVNK